MNVCVFAGSSAGRRPAYREAAAALGAELARRGMGLVYGGASIGLMGAVADAALAGGATVIGVLPRAIAEIEVAHAGLTELHVVESMHERKALMAELADAFVALPGGIGTLEETFEAWTWAQLGIQAKPVGMLDVEGFYAPLAAFVDRLVEERFLKAAHRSILVRAAAPDTLLDALLAAELPRAGAGLREKLDL